MTRKIILSLLVGFVTQSHALDIVAVEYFIDTDPGFGSGTSVSLTSGSDITVSFTANLTGVSDGIHTLYVRGKDANLDWSLTHTRVFLKETLLIGETVPSITSAEYFFDTDPGFGSGTAITVSPTGTSVEESFTADVTSLSVGPHTLVVRALDAAGNWSIVHSRPFLKEAIVDGDTLPNISALEYFIATDPGFGSATAVGSLPTGSDITVDFTASLSGLTDDQDYVLGIRGKDADNNWSLVNSHAFSVPAVNRWVGASTGDWDVTSNWSLGTVPQSTETALIDTVGVTVTHDTGTDSISILDIVSGSTLIISGGSLDVGSASVIAGDVTLSGGTLQGAGDITINGAFGFYNSSTIAGSSASLTTTGTTTISSGINIADKDWINQGTVTLSGTAELKLFSSNDNFTNDTGATFNMNSTASTPISNTFAASVFDNKGTFNKNGSSGGVQEITSGVTFNNTGTVNVNTGELRVSSGGTDTGVWDVDSGATLDFFSGTRDLNSGSDIAGLGTLDVSGGTVSVNDGFSISTGGTIGVSGGTLNLTPTTPITTFSSAISVTNGGTLSLANGATFSAGLTLDAGDLIAPGAVTVNGAFSFTNNSSFSGSGAITTTGTTTVSSGTTNDVSKDWTNQGTVTLSGSSKIRVDASDFVNDTGAVFNYSSSNSEAISHFNSGSTFENRGTFNKTSSGHQNISSSVTFSNTGTVNITGGNLTVRTFPSNAGTLNIASSRTLVIEGSAFANTSSGTIQGTGTVDVAFVTGDLLTNSGTIKPGGSAGTLSITGNVTLDSTSVIEIELGGTTAGTLHDVLAISGTATLAGTMNVSNISPFIAATNDAFQVMTFASRSGTITTVTPPFGATLATAHNTADITLTATVVSLNEWDTDSSGDWNTAGNWSLNHVPLSSEAVLIDRSAGTYTITVGNGVAAVADQLMSEENIVIAGGSLDVTNAFDVNANLTFTAASTIDGNACESSGVDNTIINNGVIVTCDCDLGTYTNGWELNDLTLTGTIAHPAEDTDGAVVSVAGDMTVNAAGSINVDSLGFDGGSELEVGDGTGGGTGDKGVGGGYGGTGGSNGNDAGGTAHGSLSLPALLGSGGSGTEDGAIDSKGGDGGGLIKLVVSGTLTHNGTISADGGVGFKVSGGNDRAAGGGSGGSIQISAGVFAGTGTIGADGGDEFGDGGSGGGGRIAVHYDTKTFTGTFSATGGQVAAAGEYGGAGTIYLKDNAASVFDLTIDNGATLASASTPVSVAADFGGNTIQNLTVNYSSPTFTGSLAPVSFTSTNFDMTITGAFTVPDFDLTNSTATISGSLTASDAIVLTGSIVTVGDTFTLDDTLTLASSSLTVANTLTDLTTTLTSISFSGTSSLTVPAVTTIQDLTIPSGTTVAHPAENTSGLTITAPNLTVDSGGSINVDSKGFDGGSELEVGDGTGGGTGDKGVGGGYGGTGGSNGNDAGGTAHGSLSLPALLGSGGSGTEDGAIDSKGGDGGGFVKLVVSGTLTHNGTISADGGIGFKVRGGNDRAAGGGSGGSIQISAGVFAGTGTIGADGGDKFGDGGSGGGGRIAVHYDTKTFTGTFSASGGQVADTGEFGGAGTIYLKDNAASVFDLTIDNGAILASASTPVSVAADFGGNTIQNLTVNYSSPTFTGSISPSNFTSTNFDLAVTGALTVPDFDITNSTATISGSLTASDAIILTGSTVTVGDTFTLDDTLTLASSSLTVANTLTDLTTTLTSITFSGTSSLTVPAITTIQDLTIPSGTTVAHPAENTSGLTITAPNLTVDSGGSINVDSKGFDGGSELEVGDGTGGGSAGNGVGGGYGGKGGPNGGSSGGTAHGSLSLPALLGSGGSGTEDGASDSKGGDGGGFVKLVVSGTLANNGTISADGGVGFKVRGGNNKPAGGGSGGSIQISAGVFAGTGTIGADGGDYFGDGGTGAGGRIAVHYDTKTFTGTFSASGGQVGNTGEYGGAGTIYLKDNAASVFDLTIANDTNAANATTPLSVASDFGGNNVGIFTATNASPTITGAATLDGIGTLSGSTVTVSDALTVNSILTVASGTLSFAGASTNNGTIDVQSGATVTGTGASFDNANGGTIKGAGTLVVSSTTFTNSGTIGPGASAGTLSITGNVALASTSVIDIELEAVATFDVLAISGTAALNGTLNVTYLGGYTPSVSDDFAVITNVGTQSGMFSSVSVPFGSIFSTAYNANDVTLTATSASTVNEWDTDSSGDWNTAGNWSLNHVPLSSEAVLIDRSAGTYTITISSGTQAVAQLSSEENIVISGGSLDIAGDSTINGDFTLSGGTLQGAGDLTVTGTFGWSGGTMSGTGTTTIPSGGALNISGASDHLFDTRTINNSGTTTFTATSAGDLDFANGAVFNNLSGGVFDIQSDSVVLDFIAGTEGAFNNVGTLRKSAGTGTSTIDIAFNNTGAVDVQTGTLSLTKGGASDNGFSGAAGTTLEFGGGTHTLNAGATVSIPNVIFSSGTVSLSDSYNATTNTTVSGGTANFNGTVTSVGSSVTVSNGTANFSSASSISTVTATLAGGTLTGSSSVTVTGTLNWSGGTMSGTGATVIPSGGAFNISGASDHLFDARTINNSGAVTFTATSAGDLDVANGAVFNNLSGGVFDIQSDSVVLDFNAGTEGAFNNVGTLRKSAGTGTSTIDIAFNNTGTVDVQTGTLSLTKGGTSDSGFSGAAGTLQFGGGTHVLNSGATISIPNVVFSSGTATLNDDYNATTSTTVSGGTANFNGTVTSIGSSVTVSFGTANFSSSSSISTTTATLSGGTINGSSLLTVTGTFGWSGGDMSGTGTTTIPSGGVLIISGASDHLFDTRTINNSGTTTFIATSAGDLDFANGAVFNNLSGGVFDIQSDSVVLDLGSGTEGAFNNVGTLRKSAGTGTSTIDIAFNNTGTVDVQTGTLSLTKGGTSDSGFSGAAGTLQFGGGTHVLNSGATISIPNVVFSSGTATLNDDYNATTSTTVSGGTANFNGTVTSIGSSVTVSFGTANFSSSSSISTTTATLSGGTINGSSSVTVTGTLNWSGGDMSGTGTTTIPSGGVLIISGASDHLFDTRTINNSGTTTFTATSAGDLDFANGAVFNNLSGGVFDIQSDSVVLDLGSGTEGAFNNIGTLQKSIGTGVSTIDIAFTNTGTVDIQTGTLKLTRGTFDNASGATIQGSGTLDVSTITFTNSGTIAPGASSGTLNITGNVTLNSSSVIEIELAATATFDVLAISGTAVLDGTLNVTYLGGYLPAVSDDFAVITNVGAQSGTFSTVSVPFGSTFTTAYNSNDVTLTTTAAFALNEWDATGSGDWETGSNWSLDHVPTSSEAALIDLAGGPFSITISSGAQAVALLSSAENIVLSGGSLDIGGESTINGDFTLSGGTLQGVGELTVSGTFNWSSGTMSGSGTTTVPSGVALNLSGSTGKVLDGRTLNNSGTVTYTATSSGSVFLNNSAIFNNQSGGVFDIQSDNFALDTSGGTAGEFNNAGTFQKSAGAGTSEIDIAFNNNSGTIAVTTGILNLSAGGTHSGTFTGGGTGPNFAGGIHDMSAVTQVEGSLNTTNGTVVSGQ